jgi:hypothetical protein
MSSKKEKLNDLYAEFERVTNENSLDITKYMASPEDMPDLGEIEIYDYDSDLDKTKQEADDYLNHLADLFLGDDDNIRKHSYIVRRVREDADVFAQMKFLQNMTVKNCITQLRQIDNGDNSARMHEVVNQTISQMRDNIKFSQNQRTDMEKMYKDLRKDLGLKDISDKMEESNPKEQEGTILNVRDLNDLIKNVK